MMDRSELKNSVVARVFSLDNENKRLRRELEECRRRMNGASCNPALWFALGYFLCCILWRAFK